ncbi:hypothetical protein GFV12_03735 [Desulfurobacterium thermolithotrophum]|uniref:hypothetical protein n=1 Tax=Desulfurobacterium thermolithotrophum TaxID=64160 RepID=UPI0013D287F4|nr:hypothetical protein [Desulfurobacterium thermolithotrophum]
MKRLVKTLTVAFLLGTASVMVTGEVANSQTYKVVRPGVSFEGTVVNVKQVPGYRRQNIKWWAIDVQTKDGTIEVRIAPTWMYSTINIYKGDKVKVNGYVPPYWTMKGIDGIMACKVVDETKKEIYDFSNIRKFCKKMAGKGDSSSSSMNPKMCEKMCKKMCKKMVAKDKTSVDSTTSKMYYRKSHIITGKVVSIKQEPGIRRKNVTWWTAELETQNGKAKVYLAPTSRFPQLNVSAGDSLKVTVFIPPMWKKFNLSNTYMACKIENLTKESEYQVRNCP